MISKGYDEYTKNIELYSYDELKDDISLKQKYLCWLNDMGVVKSILSPELMLPKDMDFIEKSFVRFTTETSNGFFIKYIPENAFVGTIKLDKMNSVNNSAEIGIMIGEKALWSKGIGQIAYKVLLKYAFEVLKLNRIWGGTDEHNVGMQKIFLNTGFKQEGRFRESNFFEGKYSDNFYYSILKEEYYEKNS